MFYIPTEYIPSMYSRCIYNTYCTPLIPSSPHKIVAFMSYPIHFMYYPLVMTNIAIENHHL